MRLNLQLPLFYAIIRLFLMDIKIRRTEIEIEIFNGYQNQG